jgi:hypothetical protein
LQPMCLFTWLPSWRINEKAQINKFMKRSDTIKASIVESDFLRAENPARWIRWPYVIITHHIPTVKRLNNELYHLETCPEECQYKSSSSLIEGGD